MTPARRFGMFFSSLICGWVKTFIRRPSPADREGTTRPVPALGERSVSRAMRIVLTPYQSGQY
jgi:hypothetical protein